MEITANFASPSLIWGLSAAVSELFSGVGDGGEEFPSKNSTPLAIPVRRRRKNGVWFPWFAIPFRHLES
jgi:hypothetical protein